MTDDQLGRALGLLIIGLYIAIFVGILNLFVPCRL